MDSPTMIRLSSKAVAYENQGDLRIALQYWEVINSLTPDRDVSTKEIQRLKKAISKKAAARLNQGITLLRQKKSDAAQKKFLAALRLEPDQTSALEFLTMEIEKDDTITYKVKSGDTFKHIAKKIYKDPDMAFLIRSFSPRTSNDLPVPGNILLLPYLERQYRKKLNKKDATCLIEKKIGDDLALAEKYFKAGNYEKVLSITECILENDSENVKAYNLTIDTYYQLGKKFKQQHDYFASLDMLQKLDPDYKDVKRLMADLDKNMKEQSEVHYRQGLKYFINEDLNKAITEWEKALMLNPANRKVKKDIRDAKGLLEKLKKIK